jgi:hypothetical protein
MFRTEELVGIVSFIVVLFAAVLIVIDMGRIGEDEPFRFSLRTLLIATTFLAVMLGLLMWVVRG